MGKICRLALDVVKPHNPSIILAPGAAVLLPDPPAGNILDNCYAAAAIALLSLFDRGAFLGRFSKRTALMAGLKMIVAGVMTLIPSYLIKSMLDS